MWAAYMHLYNKDYDFTKGASKVFMEWFCFIGYTLISCVSDCAPPNNENGAIANVITLIF